MGSVPVVRRALASQFLVAVPLGVVEVSTPPAVFLVPRARGQHGFRGIDVAHPAQCRRPGQKRGR